MIVLLPTDTTSQKAVVGSAQRVVVVRERVPRDAAVVYVPSTSGLIIQILSSRGVLDRSYNSRAYFRKLHSALRMGRSTSMDMSALCLMFPPRYTNSFVWLYTWPAAATLNMAVASGIPFVLEQMISVLASDTTTITPIIFLSFSSNCKTTLASSA